MTEQENVAKELSRLRKSRSANRNVLLGLVTKGRDKMVEEADENELADVKVILRMIQAKEEVISKVNEEIMMRIEEDKIAEDIEEVTEFEMKAIRAIADIEEYLKKMSVVKSEAMLKVVAKNKADFVGVKLPKIHVKKFTGEPTEWQQFSDTFKATVEANTRLSSIEKFSYLKGFLGGAAEKCIDGITLSENNYSKAFKLLEERYGNKQVIIASHVNKLLRLEKVKVGRGVQDLRNLFDQVESHVRSLDSLDVLSEHYGPLLIPIILERLPDDIKLQIGRKLGQESWKIIEFMETLKVEVAARESCGLMKAQGVSEEKAKGHFTTEALMTGTKILICAFCGKNHYHDKCTIVTDLDERKEIARRDRLCYKCLFKSHNIRRCHSKRNCFHCKGTNHHTAICNKLSRRRDGDNDEVNRQMSNLVGSRTKVLLQTARGIGSDNLERRRMPVKIVLDSASERTYITERMANRLRLKPTGSQRVVLNTFGNSQGKSAELKYYSFCVKNAKTGCNLYVTGFGVPVICVPLTTYDMDVVEASFPEIKELDLSDDRTGDQEIDILIGIDYYWNVVQDEIRRFGVEGLVAVNTKLGWVLGGPLKRDKDGSAPVPMHNMMVGFNENSDGTDNLSIQVEKFWDLDTLGIREDEVSVYDKFLDEVKFVNGRYQVRLPFKEDHPLLEDNYRLAFQRLKSLKVKLDKNPGLLEQYDEIVKNQLKTGIIEKAETQPGVGEVTYLPHRCVIREDKDTTKVRIVFDGSAKNKGPSLNECLYKGPSLNPLLFEILLRFRVCNIGVSADIESAYLQVSIAPEDRDYSRFLWYDDVNISQPKVEKFRFTRVFFGSRPSQFLLNGVLQMHINKYSDVDPDFVRLMLRHLYVDDLNSGVSTVEEGVELYKKVKGRFLEGNFNVRKWKSSDPEFNKFLDTQEGTGELKKSECKVLGIVWNESDNCVMDVKSYVKDVDELLPTKRNILKILASIFDVAGFMQPLTVKMKLLFQAICAAGLGWDDKIDEIMMKRWHGLVEEFRSTKTLIIPRCYCKNTSENPIMRTILHGFSDASKLCYGACIYFKFMKKNGDIKISLVTAKSRLVPTEKAKKGNKKKYTVPRLELLGNLLLSKLVGHVREAIQYEMTIDAMYCWSDSMVSLAWINSRDKEFRTFVQNRLIKIRKNVDEKNWYHCRSEHNAADILTKDKGVVNFDAWLRGPEFLYTSDAENPDRVNCALQPSGFSDELKEIKVSLHIVQKNEYSIGNIISIQRYNDLFKLLRITAFVMRFVRNLKAVVKGESLTLNKYAIRSELKEASICWIKENQRNLTNEPWYDNLKVNLNLQLDKDGVIRTFSRLKHSPVTINAKALVFINKKHKLAEMIVYYSHLKCLHRGIKQTLTEVRSCYWITSGRSYVKKLIRPCTVCKRLNARAYSYPETSDLPEFRFDDQHPFSSTGIDYIGPVYCKPVYGDDKQKVYKAWIVLFTCTFTRAISLEIVNDATADTFINSFTRFVSRRGCPNMIISDRGSVFTAETTQRFMANKLVEWKYTLDCAPWQGGMWERLVGSVKRCMKKVIGVKTVNYIELQTIISEIELILNNRPMGEDYDDDMEDVLTPNHLIFGRRLEASSDGTNVNIDVNKRSMLKRKRYMDTILDHFWGRWRKEYLSYLRESYRAHNRQHSEIAKLGDIVVIYDEKEPRHLWRTGRIIRLIPSNDGQIRGAEVKIGKTKSVVRRPVNRLYPLITNSSKDIAVDPIPFIFEANNKVMNEREPQGGKCSQNMIEAKECEPQGRNSLRNTVEAKKRPKRNAAIIGEIRRKGARN